MVVNRDLIAEQLGFKRSDVDMLLAMFCKNAASSMQEMHVMIEENNMQGITNAAHAIKGSAGNLKLDDIYDLAKTIELAARADENIDYRSCYQQLKAMLELF